LRNDLEGGVDDLEPEPPVEGDVGGIGGLQVAGHTVAVGALDDRSHQPAAEPMPLVLGANGQHLEVPVGLAGVRALDVGAVAHEGRERARVGKQNPGQRWRSGPHATPDDPGFGVLIARLQAVSPEARAWWPRHDIAPVRSGTKRLRHPELGQPRLEVTVLHSADDPEQKLFLFTPAPGDRARLVAPLCSAHTST
jgi:MmyB-like transcription regulator ligand binding domain